MTENIEKLLEEKQKLFEKKESITNEISNINLKIEEYWREKYKSDYGIEPGVIVRTNDGKKAAIVSVECREHLGNKPWINVRTQNKDGNYSKRVTNQYSYWELLNGDNNE